MATITSLGVGSGLPLQDTLDKLSDVEKQRLKPITSQQTKTINKQKAYEQLKTSVVAFQTASNELKNVDLYSGTKAISNNSDIAVSTTAKVPPGTYKVEVTQLAQAQTLSSEIVATDDPAKTLQGSTADQRKLILTKKDDKATQVTITLNKDQTTLNGIRDAINDANAGVSASLIHVTGNQYQLFISSTNTGESNALKSITVEGDDTLAGILAYDSDNPDASNMKQNVAAQNARLTINGSSEIVRQSNIITDAPQGMTLTVSKTGTADIIIDRNTDAVKSSIKGWVSAYNSLLKTIGDLSFHAPVGSRANNQNSSNGPLVGDSIIIGLKSKIREQFISPAGESKYSMLSDIGIKTTDFTTGQVTLYEDKLDEALSKDPIEVRKLLAGDGEKDNGVIIEKDKRNIGVAGRIDDLIKGYLSSKDGQFKTAEDGFSKKLADLQKQYDMVNDSINDRINAYKKQFTQLDMMVKKMDGLSKYLMQQFDALKKSTNQ